MILWNVSAFSLSQIDQVFVDFCTGWVHIGLKASLEHAKHLNSLAWINSLSVIGSVCDEIIFAYLLTTIVNLNLISQIQSNIFIVYTLIE